jgi:Caspase domain
MALNRKALIIINPGEVGAENYCEGVIKDAAIYKSFMLSGVGGAWRADEIDILKRPSQSEAHDAVASHKRADYSFIAFCGHGYYSATRDSTVLELRDSVSLDSVELRQGATKRTIILDCCRKIRRPMALDEAIRKSFARLDAVVDISECRTYFDKAISACEAGLVVMFGCAIRETAGDDAQRGGFYSYNLINSTRDWARAADVDTTTNYLTCSVVEAHNQATAHVIRVSGGTQNPSIQKPRSGKYFPFGIVA